LASAPRRRLRYGGAGSLRDILLTLGFGAKNGNSIREQYIPKKINSPIDHCAVYREAVSGPRDTLR
jgi:hypothetical protein